MFARSAWSVVLARIVALLAALAVAAAANVAAAAAGPEGAVAAESAGETRTGAWVDEVIFTEEANLHTALTRLSAGELHLVADTVSGADLFRSVQSNPDLDYVLLNGSFDSLIFNVVGPVFPGTGKLNPFAVKEIREAMNWLIDREYVVDEIFRGMARPRYTALSTVFVDHARLADVVRSLEIKYKQDFGRAEAVISSEMEKLGARKVNGVWHYNGEPVQIIMLIRIEDERRQVGDYVASLLEEIGFVVDRQYKTAAEAAPIWHSGDPKAGLFHIYTNQEIFTRISRDQGYVFESYYTPRGDSSPLWQHYTPEPRLDGIAERLVDNDFASMEERAALMAEALELSLKDSARIHLVDRSAFNPHRAELEVTGDLAGGIAVTPLWAHTLRFKDRAGGTVNVSVRSLLTEPWNPLAGSRFLYDMMVLRATGDQSVIHDPFTGLPTPHRIERAEVVLQEGLPVVNSSDWVELRFAPEIQVPGDAWAEWDPVEQRFITVAEKYPQGVTARRKSVVYYPEDLFEKLKWHDGSRFSPADVVLGIILSFDRGYEESPVFDPTEKPVVDSIMRTFKGVKIRSVDPLVIESYGDDFALDAERNIEPWFPVYLLGQAPWHSLALGIRAEASGELAFSAYKADLMGVEWANFVAGPSLAILARHLREAQATGYVPYEPTLGRFLTEDEVRARWTNLLSWYGQKGHFWLGTGPFYVERVYPVEKIVHLKRYPDYPDPAGRWDRFAEPMIADVEVTGARRVVVGAPAAFEVEVTFEGEPYPAEAIADVKFLIVNARGDVVLAGSAEEAGEGLYEIALTGDETSRLSVGPNRLEVIVVSERVSIASVDSFEFVSTR